MNRPPPQLRRAGHRTSPATVAGAVRRRTGAVVLLAVAVASCERCTPADASDAAGAPTDSGRGDAIAADASLPSDACCAVGDACDASVSDALRDASAARDIAGVDHVDAAAVVDAGPLACLGCWVSVEPGSFTRGSPLHEVGRSFDEAPFEVTIAHSFEIWSSEVTQDQFSAVAGYNPSHFSGCSGSCPVENVTWFEAAAYCNSLSEATGLAPCYECEGSGRDVTCVASPSYARPHDCPGYRLPTESEWEYVARAGTQSATYLGDLTSAELSCESREPSLDPIAWYCANAERATHPVGTKQPNAWGLFDMLGNVWEWCHERYETDPAGPIVDPPIAASEWFFAMRGGAWNYGAFMNRAAARDFHLRRVRERRIGFRPVRTLPEP